MEFFRNLFFGILLSSQILDTLNKHKLMEFKISCLLFIRNHEEKILKYLNSNKCAFIIDWFHNELIEKEIINMYWAHPPLVEQGSHNGQLSSTISSKKKSTYRRISWITRKFFRQKIGRIFNQRRIIE